MSIIQQTLMNNYQKTIDEQRMRMEKDKHQRIIYNFRFHVEIQHLLHSS